MKTHDIAKTLELISKLLRSLPNSDINQALELLLNSTSKSSKIDSKPKTNKQDLSPVKYKDISQLSAQELEKYLETDPLFVSTASILRLAAKLGLQTSKRQSRSALINLIVRHHEAGQMNSIIRSGSNPEQSTMKDI